MAGKRTKRVNVCRAAAFALVGWYLIVPPLDDHGRVLRTAPFAKWDLIGNYESAQGCSQTRDNVMASASRDIAQMHINQDSPEAGLFLVMIDAVCASANELRVTR